MGTSAIIKIEGCTYAKVYKHYDGYPSATLQWLKDFNTAFCNNRGNDPEYKLAQLLRSSARDAETYKLDQSFYTGWGVVPWGSPWIVDYIYTLHLDGYVSYEKVNHDKHNND